MDNELIQTGMIVNTHGIHGEVKLQPWADSPEFLTMFGHYYIDGAPVKVLSAKVHKGSVIAALEGICDVDSAVKMKNKVVSIKRDDVELEEGRYFITDLIGLRAVEADTGNELGLIIDVLSLPAGNVYVIKGEREMLIPAVDDFIVETNLEMGYIKIRLIDGL